MPNRTKSSKSAAPDAIELLTTDHKEVKTLFKQYDQLVESDGSEDEKQALAEQICQMLTVHATIEEELFYPAAREALGEDADLVDEADIEHASAKELIAQIEGSSPEDDHFDAQSEGARRVHRPPRQGRRRGDVPQGQESQARHRGTGHRPACAQRGADRGTQRGNRALSACPRTPDPLALRGCGRCHLVRVARSVA